MTDFLIWVLSGFWRFIGFAILLGIVVKGIIGLVAVVMNRNVRL